jgi:hypothetical protein
MVPERKNRRALQATMWIRAAIKEPTVYASEHWGTSRLVRHLISGYPSPRPQACREFRRTWSYLLHCEGNARPFDALVHSHNSKPAKTR